MGQLYTLKEIAAAASITKTAANKRIKLLGLTAVEHKGQVFLYDESVFNAVIASYKPTYADPYLGEQPQTKPQTKEEQPQTKPQTKEEQPQTKEEQPQTKPQTKKEQPQTVNVDWKLNDDIIILLQQQLHDKDKQIDYLTNQIETLQKKLDYLEQKHAESITELYKIVNQSQQLLNQEQQLRLLTEPKEEAIEKEQPEQQTKKSIFSKIFGK